MARSSQDQKEAALTCVCEKEDPNNEGNKDEKNKFIHCWIYIFSQDE